MLRFLRQGFLSKLTKEWVLEMAVLEAAVWLVDRVADMDCRGPYNHVTSQSLSLGALVRSSMWVWTWTYQLSVSGETVLRLFFDFIHVLQDAFSNLALFAYSPLREMM